MYRLRQLSPVISTRGSIRALSAQPTGKKSKRGLEGSLVMKCRDTAGIVSKVTDCIVTHCSNLKSVDMHLEKQANPDGSDVFLCRFGLELAMHHRPVAFEHDLAALIAQFDNASASLVSRDGRRVDFRSYALETGGNGEGDGDGGISIHGTEASAVNQVLDGSAAAIPAANMRVVRERGLPRAGIFVSKTEHCVLELLQRMRTGDLPLVVPYVISNHPASQHLAAALEQSQIPFYHVSTDATPPLASSSTDAHLLANDALCRGAKQAATLPWRPWELAAKPVLDLPGHETDFLILARYMRVLSGPFLKWYETSGPGFGHRPVLNIHHGLLPSFKGAAPYAQAHKAGVKLIGATAHFVTEQLDEGPIVEQQVRTVSHRDDYQSLRLKSQTLEAAALADAVQYVAQNRIAQVGGRVVVFS